MDNPNEYDDETFVEASNDLQNSLPPLIDNLWDAGATSENVEEEIANALSNTEAFRDQRITVSIMAAVA